MSWPVDITLSLVRGKCLSLDVNCRDPVSVPDELKLSPYGSYLKDPSGSSGLAGIDSPVFKLVPCEEHGPTLMAPNS
jgi:hypothetical protein